MALNQQRIPHASLYC